MKNILHAMSHPAIDFFYPSMRLLIIKLILVSLLFGNLLFTIPNLIPVYGQTKRYVTVTADQPNIWTLEQAHYLLAQMHRRNLDLRAKNLDELDVNEINGVNLEIIRTLLEVGVTYSQADQFNNSLVKKDKTFNAERSQKLTQDIDELNNQKLELTKTIARLQREKATTDEADKKAYLQAQIDENQLIKDEIAAQLEVKNAQLTAISSASGTLSPTSSSAGFDKSKFANGTFDAVIADKLKEYLGSAESKPKLNASLQLDKFVQLQYEIIAKQLTLLRDEVGPGERLIFLEMPQSINSTYDKSDDMWAQSRWKISGYTGCMLEIASKVIPCNKILYPFGIERRSNNIPRSTLDVFRSVTNSSNTINNDVELSIFDVKNKKKLVGKIVGNNPNLVTKAFAQRFFPDIEIGGTDLYNHKIDWDNYKEAMDELQKARKCENKTETDDECSNENVDYEVQSSGTNNCDNVNLKCLELKAKKAKEAIRSPSTKLMDEIISSINKAINSTEKQLNLESNYNGSYVPKRIQLLRNLVTNETKSKKLLNRLWIEDLFFEEIKHLQESDFPTQYQKLGYLNTLVGGLKIDDRTIRTVEIIPRQSSLNVDDIQVKNKSSAFNVIFSTLFGLGANANYQRQREQYSQFVQQELYSSGFGKGSREFGWTFTAMPGSKDKILSGTRNTYAIVVVPQDATSIVVESIGCSFDRTSVQPLDFADAKENWNKGYKEKKNGCSNDKNFVIPIPGGGYDSNNDFYVSGMTYNPVKKGERINIHIYGNNFSSQIGLMVNGVSLPASIGLAQNFIRDDSANGQVVAERARQEKVKGTFERVDSNQIIASFEIDNFDKGTPIITLVSPGKAIDLNDLSLYINSSRNTDLSTADWMFGIKPNNAAFRIDDVQVFISGKDKANNNITQFTALISGKNLHPINDAYVNGKSLTPDRNCKSKAQLLKTRTIECFGYIGIGKNNVLQLIFDPPTDEKIHIVLLGSQDIFKLAPISKPTLEKPKAAPPPLSFEVKKLTPIFTDEKKTKVASLLVEIVGTGFDKDVSISFGNFDIVSSTRAFITLANPLPAQTITMTKKIAGKDDLVITGVIDMAEIFSQKKP